MNVFEKIWNAICNYFIGLGDSLYLNFVKDDRYLYLTRGLAVTLERVKSFQDDGNAGVASTRPPSLVISFGRPPIQ